MALAYFLKCPFIPGSAPIEQVTVILQDRFVIVKGGSDARTQKFPSHKEAKEHVERLILIRRREGCLLVETREVEDMSTDEELGSSEDEASVRAEFDQARSRTTLTFTGPAPTEVSEESWLKRLSEATLAQVRSRMHRDMPRSVQVRCDWATPGAQLAKMLHPELEALILDTPSDTVERQSWNSAGDIAEILDVCSSLQRAFFIGSSTMSATRHDQLRELHLIGNPLKPAVLEALGGSEFPALETLAIDPGTADETSNQPLIKALRSIQAPRLSQVYIYGVPMVEFLTAIGEAPIPWSLCYCAHFEDDIEGLLEALDKLPALRECGLTLDLNEIPFESEIAQLQAKGAAFEDINWRFRPEAYKQW